MGGREGGGGELGGDGASEPASKQASEGARIGERWRASERASKQASEDWREEACRVESGGEGWRGFGDSEGCSGVKWLGEKWERSKRGVARVGHGLPGPERGGP